MSALKKENNTSSSLQSSEEKNYCIDFHGAALIDQNGQEIAITEEMIEDACNELIDDHSMTPYLDENNA